MVQLSPERMLAVLKFARSLNDAQRSNQDYLRTLPATFHTLVGADHSWVWRVHGGAAELRNIVRRIEQARRCHRRKWSNERCVLHSCAPNFASPTAIGRHLLSVGRHHASGQLFIAMFRRKSDHTFSIADFTVGHLAIGFALDSIGSYPKLRSEGIEVEDHRHRRFPGGDASLLARRIDTFLSGTE